MISNFLINGTLDAQGVYFFNFSDSESIKIQNISIFNVSSFYNFLIKIENSLEVYMQDLAINNCTFYSKEDLNRAILYISDSLQVVMNTVIIENNLMNIEVFMKISKINLISEVASIKIIDLTINNSDLSWNNIHFIVTNYIYFENYDEVYLNNSAFTYLLTNNLIILSEIKKIEIDSSYISFLNNELNQYSSSIITVKESPLVLLNNIICSNSYSFSSTTCVVFMNPNTNSNINLENSIFSDNIAKYLIGGTTHGTAIYSMILKGDFIIRNCTVTNNKLIENEFFSAAPCLYSASLEDNLNISDSLFSNNSADFAETCFFHQGNSLLIVNTEFNFNKNPVMDSSSNAAFSTSSFFIYLTNVTFIGNEASNGAAILVQNAVNKPYTFAEFDQIYLSSNVAVYSSMLFSSNINIFEISIKNSYFFNNSGLIKGGVFQTWYALYGNTLTFTNCNFESNRAWAAGGAAYIANLGNNLIFINCNFINNQALKDGGGAINMYGDPNTIVMSQNCNFINNSAPQKGGFLLLVTGVYSDDGSYYSNNTANEAGLIAINFFSILTMQNSILLNSTAKVTAGTLKLMGQSDVTLTNVTIKFSYAPKGGVFVTGGLSALRIYSCFFEGNQASNATIMYATNTAYGIIVDGSEFTYNKGSRNAFELSSCTISITNTHFHLNSVNLFYSELSTMNLENLLISDQKCKKGQFGCLMNIMSRSIITLNGSVILNIFSEETNGNIILDISTLIIQDTHINNISIGIQGDLIQASQSTINFSNIIVQNFYTIPIYLVNCDIFIENSKIFQEISNKSQGIGGLLCLNCKKLKMMNTSLENISNSNQFSGSLTIIGSSQQENNFFSIENCKFAKNWGLSGGSISINNTNVSIVECEFSSNIAETGAGIYFYCSLDVDCIWNLENNTFINNTANVSGGAIKWEPYEPLNVEKNEYLNNEAFFGPNFASQPVRFSIQYPEDLEQFTFFSSGNTTSTFSLSLLDYYGQTVKGVEGLAIIKLSYENDTVKGAKQIVGLLGSQVISFLNNSFTFQDLTLVATPETSLYLIITSGLVPYYFSDLLERSDISYSNKNNVKIKETADPTTREYQFKIEVEMRQCLIGEIYNINENTCNVCPFGQYSLTPNATSCSECPGNSVCMGGFNISLNPGYWRSNTSSIEIYECILSDVCYGGYESSCRNGYTGPLCDVCIIDNKIQYYKFGGTTCDSCENENPVGYVIFILFYLVMIAYVVFTIKKNIDSVNAVETLSYEIPVFLKIGMDYVQVVSTISLLNIKWPSTFSSFLSTSGSAGNLNSIMFPFECVLAKLPIELNVFYLKIFLGSGFAWFNFLFSGLIWIVYMKLKGKTMNFFKKEIIITMIVVGFTIQPSLVNMYFVAMNCIDIDGIPYVKKQMTIQCWEGEHLSIFFIFVLPSLLLWSVILPLICFFYVKNNITSKDYQTRASLIYITKGVRSQYYYWEFVMMAKRYCVSLVSAFLISDLTLTTSLILLIIISFSLLHLYLKPYNLEVFNVLQDFSFMSSFFVFFLCLYYVVDQEAKSQLICLIFLIIGLFIFIIKFAKYILKAYSEKLKVIVSKIDSFVSSKRKAYLSKRSMNSVDEKQNREQPSFDEDNKGLPKFKSQGGISIIKTKENKGNHKNTIKIMPAHSQNKHNKTTKVNQLKSQEINIALKIK